MKITIQQLLDLDFQPCYLKESYEYHFKNTIFIDEYGDVTITNGKLKGNVDIFDLMKLMKVMEF